MFPYAVYLTYNISGGAIILCSDTGEHQAIHIPKPVIELAIELSGMIDAITKLGDGEAEISMKVQPGGHIPSFRCFFSKSRRKRKNSA